MRSSVLLLLATTLPWLGACQRSTVVNAPFTAALEVAPDEIHGGDGFRVRLGITNRAARTYALTSPNGCVTSLHVVRGSTAVPLEGTAFGCTEARTTFEFAAEETRWFEFRLAAVIEGRDGRLPAPGAYEITATPHVNLPPVHRGFLIMEPEPDDDEDDDERENDAALQAGRTTPG